MKFFRWLAAVAASHARQLAAKAPSMKRGAQPAALGWLLIAVAMVALTTSWWPAAIPLALAGVLLPGAEELAAVALEGFAEALGWTEEDDEVE